MKLYVVRHCSTECSEKKIYCGSTDVPLSPRGEREAEMLSAAAKNFAIDLVLSSPLLRARRTAEAVVGGRDIPILYDERLQERRFGGFEGTSCSRPEGERCRYNFAVRYPGGESNLALAARVYALLGELKARYAEKTVCLVSHGSACRVIRTYFMDMTDEEFYAYSQPPASIEEYDL